MKNPEARRSIAVRAWTARADRVLFLTGSPMENRVEEFKNLVGYLQPQVLPSISGTDAVAGAVAFRQAVAPVYLRRNQEDVLTELPDLVSKDEWVEFSAPDFRIYRDAVASGNFMSMRRAALRHRRPSTTSGEARPPRRTRRRRRRQRAQGRHLLLLPRRARHRAHRGQRTADLAGARAAAGSVPAGRSNSRGAAPAVAAPGRSSGRSPAASPPVARQRMVDEFSAVDGPRGAGQPDPGRRRRPQHPGGVGRHHLRAAGQADDRRPGDRAQPPHGPGAHRCRCTGC